jgi:hypothetical protein
MFLVVLTYVCIPKELCQKLEMKAHECIFLGYGETKGHKAYRLYEKIEKNVILKRDVTFNEVVMVLKEWAPILYAYVYDSIKGQNEGFMLLDFKVDEHIPPPHVIPIVEYSMHQIPHPQLY